MPEPSADTPSFDRDETIDEIVALENQCGEMRERIAAAKRKSSRFRNLAKAGLTRVLIGPALMRSLNDFIQVAGTDRSRVLGPELAQTLDAAAGKVIGKKRWITVIALLAASPAILSLWLLVNGWQITKKDMEDSAYMAELYERANWLNIIYTINESWAPGKDLTPVYSIRGRRDAVLNLMEHDLDRMENQGIETDFWGNVSRVIIDGAPLTNTNFSPTKQGGTRLIERLALRGSSLRGTSFSNCKVVDCSFQSSFLNGSDLRYAEFVNAEFRDADFHGADATGAVFRKCDFTETKLSGVKFLGAEFDEHCRFTNARYDAETSWPIGFDPDTKGMILMEDDEEEEVDE